MVNIDDIHNIAAAYHSNAQDDAASCLEQHDKDDGFPTYDESYDQPKRTDDYISW